MADEKMMNGETAQSEAETENVTEEAAETETAEETVQETEHEEAAEEAEAAEPEHKDKKDEQIAELKDRLMRQMAEFDNYRKRTDKEKKANYELGESEFLLKLLPVVDNFERGFEALEDEDRDDAFAKGMDMIYKQLMKLLEDEGVTPIDAAGKPFDPMLHNAVMQQPSETVESGTVIQEFQKGYMFKDRVLRHSMVIVAE